MKKHIIVSLLLLLCMAARLPAQDWHHLGPFRDSVPGNVFETGRADCIAVDPAYNGTTNKTIYLGSYSGGLWKTTDGGAYWENIGDGGAMTYNGVSALAVAPGVNGPVYVADHSKYASAVTTLVGCSGIYKYYPVTGAWLSAGPLPGVTQPLQVNHIKIHPANSNYVFACTNQGLFRSTNAGVSWTSVGTPGAYENVVFMPRTGGLGTYQYFVYASGQNKVEVSSDDGVTFYNACIQTHIAGYQSAYVDLAITQSSAAYGVKYLYAFAALNDATPFTVDFPYYASTKNAYALYRMVFDSTANTESCDTLVLYGEYETNPVNYIDRLCVAANDEVAFFGGVGLFKFNCITDSLYAPNVPYDVAETSGSLGWGQGGIHADYHDMLFLPALDLLFVANDGGFARNSYTPLGSGRYANSWSVLTNGLHISQIWGFSAAETDPDFFMTGEADTKNFLTSTASTTYGVFGIESPAGIIDKFDSDMLLTRNYSYFNTLYYSLNRGASMIPLGSKLNFASPSDECAVNYSTEDRSVPFATNTCFQDPNRPGHIFNGSVRTLNEWCPSSHILTIKYRPYHYHYAEPDSMDRVNWFQTPYYMAFSRADKNKTYFALNNSYEPLILGTDYAVGQIFAFTGSDIDNSWYGNNENQWQLITPDYTSATLLTVPMANAKEASQIQNAGLVASDWNPDRIWLACRVPGNPDCKILKYESGVWTDYGSVGIPSGELAVSLEYEHGSNDMLYLGTNRNIYYRNASMSSWGTFGIGLPHANNVKLEINYVENQLRTGTYGRGVWSSDLKCPGTLDTTCSGTLVVDKFVEMKNSITAQNMTISGGDVKFRAGLYVDLLPNFLVTADASTEFFAFIHNCDGPGHTLRKGHGSGGSAAPGDPENTPLPGRGLMSVYPNPNDGHFFLQKETEGKLRIEIFSTMGQLVYSNENVSEGQLELDLSAQPDGIYLVRCIAESGAQILRIVKQ